MRLTERMMQNIADDSPLESDVEEVSHKVVRRNGRKSSGQSGKRSKVEDDEDDTKPGPRLFDGVTKRPKKEKKET